MTDQLGTCVVVDDDHDTADSLAIALECHGYVVKTAYGARYAVALVAQEAPDVVVSDIEMPGMNGLEEAMAIRQLGLAKRPWLVAVTGSSHPEVEKDALAAGFDRFVSKPTDVDLLLSAMRHS